MPVPDFTPYAGLLPSASDPATFSPRASELFTWFVETGAPQLAALAAFLDGIMDDETTVLDALDSLQASLGDLSTLNVSDLTLDENSWKAGEVEEPQLISPGDLGAVIAATRPQLIGSWEASGFTNEIEFTDLAGWDAIKIFARDLNVYSENNLLQVSFDNGATFETSGYESRAGDYSGAASSSSGLLLGRGDSGAIHGGADLGAMTTGAILFGAMRSGGRPCHISGQAPLGTVNAIRLALGNSTNSGSVSVYGVVRA